jgi:L-lactate utilization protein LutC
VNAAREAFLERVRKAVASSHRPGEAASIEPRGQVGYAGAGADPVATFATMFAAAGGQLWRVADPVATTARVLEIVQQLPARKILLGRGPFLDSLALTGALGAQGRQVISVDDLDSDLSRDDLFAAELSITGVDYLISESGTIVVCTRPEEPRSLSLLPPVHIAVAERKQLLPDLFDLFESTVCTSPNAVPSCITLITGPSKTGDIELRLVTGVHGPGQVHVVLCES